MGVIKVRYVTFQQLMEHRVTVDDAAQDQGFLIVYLGVGVDHLDNGEQYFGIITGRTANYF